MLANSQITQQIAVARVMCQMYIEKPIIKGPCKGYGTRDMSEGYRLCEE